MQISNILATFICVSSAIFGYVMQALEISAESMTTYEKASGRGRYKITCCSWELLTASLNFSFQKDCLLAI